MVGEPCESSKLAVAPMVSDSAPLTALLDNEMLVVVVVVVVIAAALGSDGAEDDDVELELLLDDAIFVWFGLTRPEACCDEFFLLTQSL